MNAGTTGTTAAQTPLETTTDTAAASRRDFIKKSTAIGGAAFFSTLGHSGVWAAGSDAPEKTEVKIGFIPLTDCASVVMAAELGIDKKYGVQIIPTKEASWAGVRDKLVNGELDLAHVLHGLIYGLQLGTAGPKKDMAILMNLNQNGQAITLSKKLADKGAVDGPSLAKLMAAEKREYTFAHTFPTGNHAMLMYYWLAAAGIDPMQDVRAIVVPPPQMVANMRVGNMDGFCVGEPWNHRAITRAKLQDELLDIVARTHSTVVMVTHDVDEAVLLSDRIVMLSNGPAATIGEVLTVGVADEPKYQQCRKAVIDFLYTRQAHIEKVA